MRRLILVIVGLLIVTGALAFLHAAPQQYVAQGSVSVAPTAPLFTAVDPLAYAPPSDVIPPRPFLYSVDSQGITITRFNDNRVVGRWPWPERIFITLPDGSWTDIPKPAGGWEPVGITVSYPTALEFGNRVKPIPDLTPPWTFVYVVMAHSGMEWKSEADPARLQSANVRDKLVPSTNPDTESSMLVQINVSDPSFSTSYDPVAPTEPHIAGAILGHGAGQPVYDRKTANVIVGNMPSNSLPAGLTSFLSVIRRIPPEVTAEEAEIPGISIPVIRCGPQHPEVGIPVGRPQAFACYDPGGMHTIDDNEHSGSLGNYEWEFRNLPAWLTPHYDKATGKLDGILYGTPPGPGEWFAEARVHDLDDPYGIFSYWTPIWLLVNTGAEYLPIKSEFAVGEPASWPLEGTGSCGVVGAPAWIDVKAVPNGCVVMGRAPIAGEHYDFTMPGFSVAGYPGLSVRFSGDVVGSYSFVPLPQGVGLSGLAWHQVSKVADPSTETAVLSLEYIGVQPSTGQMYRILPPPGLPKPPNERPPETALTVPEASAMTVPPLGATLLAARPDLSGHLLGFGNVAVEADGDIFVAAVTDGTVDGALMKISGSIVTPIRLAGVQARYLDLDSDLRPAIIGVEPGQVDNGVLFVSGTTTGKVAVVDTAAGTVAQTLEVSGASALGGVSVDFGTKFLYAAAPSLQNVAIFAPTGTARPQMRPRIWSTEEVTWNHDSPGTTYLMASGDPVPTLTLLGTLPQGLTFTDNGNGTATLSGRPTGHVPGSGGGSEGEGDPEGEGGDFAFTLIATSPAGTYAQAFGISVQIAPKITSGNETTFTVGAASSFTITGTGQPTPIFFTWDESLLPAGVLLVDNENGTASLVGTPTTAGNYLFDVNATTDCEPDAVQHFTLHVNPAGAPGEASPPVFTGPHTVTWETIGAPFPPDPFVVTTTGSPTPALSIDPATPLPPGVTFADNHDSTATIGGTPVTEGTYTFNIRATNGAGTTVMPFTLVVEVLTNIIGASPATMTFAYIGGGPLPPAQTLQLTTLGDTLPYAIVTTADWLKVTPIYGTMPTAVTVSIDPSALTTAGTFTGTVIVTSAGTEGPFATSAVTLTVTGEPGAGATTVAPAVLSFAHNGNVAPGPQTISIVSGGTAANFTVASDAPWLTATPSSGTTPGLVTVSVSSSQLAVGGFTGNLKITSAGLPNGAQTVPVRVVKTGPSGEFKISFAVGSGPEGLALDRTTHQLFIASSTEAAAPEVETGTEVEMPEPTTASSETAVFRFDPATGTGVPIMVHGEAEYVGVNSTTGLVYHADQDTWVITVINGRTNQVLGYLPLLYEGRPYQPYQIAIDEAQNLIYVGAKAPPIPDPAHVAPFPCKAIHEMPDDEYDCWNPGKVFVIDGMTNQFVLGTNGQPMHFMAGDDPEGVVFAAATGKVYASNEDDGSITVARGAVRNANGSITPPVVLSTIIRGEPVAGWWQPVCDANNYCGERGQAALWPQRSACNGIDDEAEEADKMTVDPHGDVYIIDDRYRVAKIDGQTDKVLKVLEIAGYQCEAEVPDGSLVEFPNTANNIAFFAPGNGMAHYNPNDNGWRLYVTSEQDTVAIIDPLTMTLKANLTIPGAAHLDAITTDPELSRIYISDEELGGLWIVQAGCATNQVCSTCITNLAAASKNKQVQLTWAVTGAHHYNVYRSTTSGGPYTFLGTALGVQTVFIDKTVTNGATYYYVVRPATLDETELCQSNQVIGKPKALM